MKTFLKAAVSSLVVLIAGCADDVKSGRRLHLPQGSVEKGQAAFVALNCTTCHTVAGLPDLPKPTKPIESVVVLGGDVARLRTVGDLLTSIIHPAHALSEKWVTTKTQLSASPMPVVNDTMTVAQMIDLVAFLQIRYTQIPPAYEGYYLW